MAALSAERRKEDSYSIRTFDPPGAEGDSDVFLSVLALLHLSFAIMVSVQFWAALYRKETLDPFLDLTTHCLCAVFAVLDLCFCRMQVQKRTSLYAVIVGLLLYLPINFAYSYCVRPVYHVMTWRSWTTLLFVYVAAADGLLCAQQSRVNFLL
ncbi:MAG: hypothetical protein MHM6MM_000160 [Cercozoa sp. M6MM]